MPPLGTERLQSSNPYMTEAESLVGQTSSQRGIVIQAIHGGTEVAFLVPVKLPIIVCMLSFSLVTLAVLQVLAAVLLVATDESVPLSDLPQEGLTLLLPILGVVRACVCVYVSVTVALNHLLRRYRSFTSAPSSTPQVACAFFTMKACFLTSYKLALTTYLFGMLCHAGFYYLMSVSLFNRASVVVVGTEVLHVFVLVVGMAFAGVWIRTVGRFRSGLEHRRLKLLSMVNTLATRTPAQMTRIVAAMVALQHQFRRASAMGRNTRNQQMKLWHSLKTQRMWLLGLVYFTCSLYLIFCMYLILIFASKFTPEMTTAWLAAASFAYGMDLLLYNTLGLLAKSLVLFLVMIASGVGKSTLARGVGKLTENIRWICSDFFM